MESKNNNRGLFLPDFNSIKSVFTLIIFGELLAVMLALFRPITASWIEDLSLSSLFIQWTILLSAALLTLMRPLFQKSHIAVVIAITYAIILSITTVNSIVAMLVILENNNLDNILNLVVRNCGIAAIVSLISLRYFYLQFQLKRQLLAESRSRIAALQSRIRPHFLFNSMNTIAALVRSKPDIAEQTIEDLADLFRESLGKEDRHNTLKHELRMAKKYLRIEKLRLGERMSVKWNVSEAPLDAVIPHITLQPLLENAVYHGIEPMVKGGTIQLSAKRNQGELIILISNSLPEHDSEKVRKGHQIAINNTRERLKLFYSTPGKLETIEKSGYFTVELRLPYQKR